MTASDAGRLTSATLRSHIPDLPEEVMHLLNQVPSGCVTTYGDLARALGDKEARAAYWLGEFFRNHPHGPECNCHRVVRSTGEVGHSISGNSQNKAQKLRSEGISVSSTGKVSFATRMTEFRSRNPLEKLQNFQKSLASQVRETPLKAPPRTIGGLDVAYSDPETACAAYVLLDAESLEVLWEHTLSLPVAFPYIPRFLTFRELPALLDLCQVAADENKLADLLFVDGNGRLHPWRSGIATCLGVALNHPTVGIGKSLLCGKLLPEEFAGAPRPILDQEEIIGMAVTPPGRRNCYYVSIGNNISLTQATDWSIRWTQAHNLPEPIFLADQLSKRAKRLKKQ